MAHGKIAESNLILTNNKTKQRQSNTIEGSRTESMPIKHNRTKLSKNMKKKIDWHLIAKISSKTNRIDWCSAGFDWFDWPAKFDYVWLVTPGSNQLTCPNSEQLWKKIALYFTVLHFVLLSIFQLLRFLLSRYHVKSSCGNLTYHVIFRLFFVFSIVIPKCSALSYAILNRLRNVYETYCSNSLKKISMNS